MVIFLFVEIFRYDGEKHKRDEGADKNREHRCAVHEEAETQCGEREKHDLRETDDDADPEERESGESSRN